MIKTGPSNTFEESGLPGNSKFLVHILAACIILLCAISPACAIEGLVRPATLWTRENVVALIAVLVFATVCIMSLWRYLSLVKINRELRKNIAERKQAEEKISEQSMIMEHILEQSLAGYWDWRKKDGMEYLSPTFKRMFGYEDHELPNVPETWRRLIFPEDLPEVTKSFRKHVESHGEYPFYNEVRYHHRNGSAVWVICTGSVIEWDADNQPVRMIGCHVDITRRKSLEIELQKAHAELVSNQARLRNLCMNQQYVREEERANIAREIHDELGQIMTAIRMDVSWLKGRYSDHEVVAGKTSAILKLIDTTIKSVRRICTELRPDLLDHLGIGAAIQWQAEEFQDRTGILCEVDVEEGIEVDGDRSIALFRIFQEALTNVLRHANATKVTASLKNVNGPAILKISDNGKGITEEEISKPDSFGLLGMRERVYPWRGRVSINGSADKGTIIEVIIPG